MRIDLYLAENGFAKSREQAKELIRAGRVFVGDKTVGKPALSYSGDGSDIAVKGGEPKYVGRGGLKLEKALSEFGIDVEGRICADIGASTGGFTDCMLKNGASLVYAVDVGHGQLDKGLAEDRRVVNMEGRNIRDMSAESFPKAADFIAADVSFVSLKLILPKIAELLPLYGEAAALIKPQFEAGRQAIGKNGIVKDRRAHISVLEDIAAFCFSAGLPVQDLTYSPITGGSGNIEYLARLKKGGEYRGFDCEKIVSEAFSELRQAARTPNNTNNQ